MRFMIMVKASKDTEDGVMPSEKLLADMAAFHKELAEAGVLVDASGLRPGSTGWRIKYSGDARTLSEGPFADAEELVAGYTIIQVASREEAREWSQRFPNPAGAGRSGEIEVRQFFELDDFGESPAIKLFREMGKATISPGYS